MNFCEFALISTVSESIGKTTFKLVHEKNMILPLDHLTGANLHSYMQASRKIAKEVV